MGDSPIGLDTEQLTALAAEFRRIRSRLRPAMRKVTSKAALNIKNDAKARIIAQSTRGYVAQYPRSITYTITESSGSTVAAEIGPDKDKPQGPLGNILEYGTSKNPPSPHLQPALDAEADAYEQYLGDAAAEAVLE